MARSFSAQISAFKDKTLAQMKAVVGASVQDVMEAAQLPEDQGGRLPVKTSFLRNSLVSELNGSKVAEGPESFTLVAAQIEPGDTARFAYTAAYALRMELGFVGQDSLGRTYNQSGRHFVEGAAAQWPAIVERNAARLK